MEIDESRTYRVILNNKLWGYKPDKETLRLLGWYLPKCKVLGYGPYGFMNYWYLLVYSPSFPIRLDMSMSNLTWSQATGAFTIPTIWNPNKPPSGSGPKGA